MFKFKKNYIKYEKQKFKDKAFTGLLFLGKKGLK